MGNLPDSRPATYVPGMPLAADHIDEIFDTIIGGKFKSRPFSYPAQRFTAGAGSLTVDGSGEATLADSTDAMCTIDLPVGARITEIAFSAKHAIVTGDLRLRLRRRAPGGAAADVLTGTIAVSSGGVYVTHNLIADFSLAAHTIAAGYHYWLSFLVNGDFSTALFDGAIVTADKL